MSELAAAVRISVVTPTHDRAESLLRLLRALGNGNFPVSDIEAIVVADGCSDDTAPRARNEPWPFRVTVLEQNPGRGAAAARNAGAAQANGELLVFLDDDIEPFPNLLDEHWREHQQATSQTAVIGMPRPVRTPNAGLHALSMWSWWENEFAAMQRPGHRFRYQNVFSGNLSLRRSLFERLGGFDDDFQCREDSEFGLRLLKHGVRLAFVPAAAGWHHELRDTVALHNRKQAEGVADVRLAKLYPQLWHSLYLALPEQRSSRTYSAVRQLAFAAPRFSRLIAAALDGFLLLFEAMRMRGTWRRLQAGLMYYWYWIGVARATEHLKAFEALRSDCLARGGRATTAPDMDIDLAEGLLAAERTLDEVHPASATIRFGSLYVGRIPTDAGAEPLGGRHLRAALAGDLAREVTNVLAAVAAAGSPALHRSDGTPVSVIIPAYNAAATLGETLDSLIRQTHPRWEAIVVDDGSTDDTAVIAARYAARDNRIRVLRQRNGGEGAARNAGLVQAQHEWVLFLDADDWILPDALRLLTHATVDDATLDAVHGGWSRVAGDGSVMEPEYCPYTGDLFVPFTRLCVLIIHSTLVRRSLAHSIGQFHPSLRTCADWDFWQRIARAGARFGRVNQVIAHYRMRAGSASTLAENLWADGLQVIALGHSPDPRVATSAHPTGAPIEQHADARFEYACWIAGLMFGQATDPTHLVADLQDDRAPGLHPEACAEAVFGTVTLVTGRALDAWDELWPDVSPRIEAFFAAIEQQSGARLFAARAMRALERLTLNVSRAPRPFVRGGTYALDWDVARSLTSLQPPQVVERGHCVVLADGSRVGALDVPINCDAEVNRRCIEHEAAQRFAWPILGWFLRGTRYRDCTLARGPQGITVTRKGVPLGSGLTDAEATNPVALHDRVGWTVFLQELWGRPDLTGGQLYVADHVEPDAPSQHATTERLTIEVSDALPSLSVAAGSTSMEVDVRVGGASIGIARVPVTSGEVTSAMLRVTITEQSAFALCRAAVRGGVLGQPRDLGGSMRERLAARSAAAAVTAASARAFPTLPNDAGNMAGQPFNYDRHHFESIFARATDPWSYITGYEQFKYEQTLALAPEGRIPRALELACAEGRFTRQLAPRVDELLAMDISTVALERAKAACEGLPNVEFGQLDLVTDTIPTGFDLVTCSEVLYYLNSEETLLAVGAKLRDALAPAGRLVLAHTNVAVDDPNETGLEWDVPFGAKRIGEVLATVPRLRFVREVRTELYRIQVFERAEGREPSRDVVLGPPDVVEIAPHVPPDAYLATHFRRPREMRAAHSSQRLASHYRLPILMYHDVAPVATSTNGARPWRYRVSPNAFEKQLQYLRNAGFRSVTLDEWHAAMHYRRPLPDRSIIITFDDAYRSFTAYAFPLLQKYGFSAIVFVPCGFAGARNAWDEGVSEQVPILGWDEIRELAAHGIQFGAHSMTHPPLTGLANADVLREAAESKAILERELRRPVTAFAYPYGDNDAIVQELVAQSGYSLALTTRFGRAAFTDLPMALPRLDVSAHDDLATFIRNLDA